MQRQSFETFYYRNVASGEGCGCAERIIDVHEVNRLAGTPRLRPLSKPGRLRRMIASVFRRRTHDED